MASGGLTNSGTIDVAAGATLNANLMTFADGTTFAGAGTITMPGTTTVTAANLNLTLPTVMSSWLLGPGKVTVIAPFTWTGNSIGIATLEIASGAAFRIHTGADHGLNNTVLRNHGTVEWTDGGRLLYQSGLSTVVNEADGVWNVAAGVFTIAGGAGQVSELTGLELPSPNSRATGSRWRDDHANVTSTLSFTAGTTAGITIIY
jgi:hypothetical protein